MFVKFLADGTIHQEKMEKGIHYIKVALNEVPLFIRENKCIPVGEKAEYIDAVNDNNLTLIGYEGAEYLLYSDDGIHKNYDTKENYRTLK